MRRRASYSPPSRRLIVQSWDFSLSAESDPADANLGMACANEPQLAGRALGKVDNPAFDERTAVVDAHDNRLSRLGMCHLDLGAKRERLVRGGHGGRVHHLAGSGARMQRVP